MNLAQTRHTHEGIYMSLCTANGFGEKKERKKVVDRTARVNIGKAELLAARKACKFL